MLDLSPHDLEEMRRILRAHIPEYEVWAFGSRAKGTAKPYSDLDLAIISEEPISLATMADIREAFDDSDMTIKVDVVDWATTSEAFKRIIEEHRVVVSRDNEEAAS
ncbi:MAG TPA: nucleotidyltransferase domain-containing protein [Geomonas sp.]|nr:nucleotidyltransferase domain-containing protein [Geomonas sp.]